MEEVDRHEFDGSKFAVDSANKFVDNGAKILVFFDILSARNGHLHENYFADPFRVFREEDFESVQLLGDSLYIIEPVNPNNKLDSLEFAFQNSDSILD
jgi:hypothetical protein